MRDFDFNSGTEREKKRKRNGKIEGDKSEDETTNTRALRVKQAQKKC